MDEGRVVRGSEVGWNTGTTREYVDRHDWAGSDTLAVTIVAAAARARGVDELALPPLADAVDPDALERLFAAPLRARETGRDPRAPGSRYPTRGRIQFRYADTDVTVWSDGTVVVDAG